MSKSSPYRNKVRLVSSLFLVGTVGGAAVGGQLPVPGAIAMNSISASSAQVSPEAVAFFKEIAFGSEFKEGRGIRKWTQPIHIALLGNPNPEDIQNAQSVVADLARLIGHSVPIKIVASDANVEVHFVPETQFAQILPNYVPGNLGFFSIPFTDDGAIASAQILITSSTRVSQQERNHLFREELAQSLGLMKDTSNQAQIDSIFQQSWTAVQKFSPLDEQVISLLYDPRLKPEMTVEEVDNALGRVAIAPSKDVLFEGGSNSVVAIAVGSAEGTRTPDGGKAPAFTSHVDPGNGVVNLGTFSYQHGAASPEEADAKQLERLKGQLGQIADQLPSDIEVLLNAADLLNQSPRAGADFGKYLKECGGDILCARVASYEGDAPGIVKNGITIEQDQSRRMGAIAQVLKQHNLKK